MSGTCSAERSSWSYRGPPLGGQTVLDELQAARLGLMSAAFCSVSDLAGSEALFVLSSAQESNPCKSTLGNSLLQPL